MRVIKTLLQIACIFFFLEIKHAHAYCILSRHDRRRRDDDDDDDDDDEGQVGWFQNSHIATTTLCYSAKYRETNFQHPSTINSRDMLWRILQRLFAPPLYLRSCASLVPRFVPRFRHMCLVCLESRHMNDIFMPKCAEILELF